MPTLAELKQEFYATQLGLNQPWPSLTDLEYTFYLGVHTGDIVIGGGGGAPTTKPGVFVVTYNGTAWDYTTLAACQAAGLGINDKIWFLGLADPPAYRRSTDVWTQA